MMCQDDWFRVYGSRALQHFGYLSQPRVLTQDNAWSIRRDWNNDSRYAYNHLTEERRPLTQQQYDNDNIITEDGRLAI